MITPDRNVDVVCVEYRTPARARQALRAVLGPPVASRVLVRVAPLPGEGPAAPRELRLAANHGFGAAANRGAAAGRAPWILFLNADCRPAPGAVETLLAAAAADPDAVAVGPAMVDAAGRPARSAGVDLLRLGRLFDRGSRPLGFARARAVDWVSGACLLVRRTAFHEVGGFDQGFFLYCEDVDLCRRLRARGGRVLCEPRARAEHLGGASFAGAAAQAAAYRGGRARYLAKHGGFWHGLAWKAWQALRALGGAS